MERLLNEKIIHVKFGVGIIVDVVEGEKIIVKFDEIAENKVFQYPEAFECFLKFETEALQEDSLKQLLAKREREDIAKEEMRLKYEVEEEERKKEASELAKKEKQLKQRRKKTLEKLQSS